MTLKYLHPGYNPQVRSLIACEREWQLNQFARAHARGIEERWDDGLPPDLDNWINRAKVSYERAERFEAGFREEEELERLKAEREMRRQDALREELFRAQEDGQRKARWEREEQQKREEEEGRAMRHETLVERARRFRAEEGRVAEERRRARNAAKPKSKHTKSKKTPKKRKEKRSRSPTVEEVSDDEARPKGETSKDSLLSPVDNPKHTESKKQSKKRKGKNSRNPTVEEVPDDSTRSKNPTSNTSLLSPISPTKVPLLQTPSSIPLPQTPSSIPLPSTPILSTQINRPIPEPYRPKPPETECGYYTDFAETPEADTLREKREQRIRSGEMEYQRLQAECDDQVALEAEYAKWGESCAKEEVEEWVFREWEWEMMKSELYEWLNGGEEDDEGKESEGSEDSEL